TVTTRDILRDGVDRALEQRARAETGPRRPGPPGRPRPDPLGAGDTTSRVFDLEGDVLTGPAVAEGPELTERDLAVAAGAEAAYFRDADVDDDHVRVLTVPLGDGRALQL